ncbi:hypothetical protein LEP1GSC188_0008 [Leptospira weilii serovar Topaz str. LT2116]|uniref:Uncharacterized protein n=1 Tax=Leptospira weilii serovar Topaz str. LT2116 TaxID=1088540 RepID=M3G3G9_9LEPT|nr:hypothetical protein LEP1GSC188_0008 [Leptospira weilii serovar Topaz str. LT2116]
MGSYKQRKELALDLKAIYQSPSEDMAKKCLDDFLQSGTVSIR